jgi:predicted O-methyltransferase YrrM
VPPLVSVLRSALWYTPLRRYLFYRYRYSFTPEQLAFLVKCVNDTKDVPGDVLEIGCAAGNTTCFLYRHLEVANINKDYWCVDTFSGFTPQDIAYEREQRGKKGCDFSGFRVNSLRAFKYTLALNGCHRVKAIQTDVTRYSFTGTFSFCLLDVDLYRPTIAALKSLWPRLSNGAIIVVDDCLPNQMFDGAFQAYVEFVREKGFTTEIVLDKLGILRKIHDPSP